MNVILTTIKVGFHNHKSTVLTAAGFTDDIAMGLNNGHYTLACIVYLRRAFDTVNHKILIDKLHNFG